MRKVAFIRWLLAVVGAVLLGGVAADVALAHGPSTGGASIDAVRDLFNTTLLLAIPVFLLVEGLIIFAVLRYRRRPKDEMPVQVHGNTALEITWTVLAFAIIAVLFVLTLRALNTEYRAEAEQEETTPDYTVDVIGYSFNWDYKYYIGLDEDTGVQTTRRITIPTNRNVLLRIMSRDVVHSFWVPDLAGKVDAVPGYTNTQWLKVKEPGCTPATVRSTAAFFTIICSSNSKRCRRMNSTAGWRTGWQARLTSHRLARTWKASCPRAMPLRARASSRNWAARTAMPRRMAPVQR